MKRAVNLGVLLAGLLAGAIAAEPVKIGFFMSITGRDASFDEVSPRVARLIEAGAPYSVGLAEYLEKTFRAFGGEIVASQKYSGADTGFRAQLKAIRAAKPDAIFLPGYYVAAGLVARQARELGIKAPLLGGDGFEAPQLLEIGGEAMEGAYYSTHFATENTGGASRDADKEAAIIPVRNGRLSFVEAIRP